MAAGRIGLDGDSVPAEGATVLVGEAVDSGVECFDCALLVELLTVG